MPDQIIMRYTLKLREITSGNPQQLRFQPQVAGSINSVGCDMMYLDDDLPSVEETITESRLPVSAEFLQVDPKTLAELELLATELQHTFVKDWQQYKKNLQTVKHEYDNKFLVQAYFSSLYQTHLSTLMSDKQRISELADFLQYLPHEKNLGWDEAALNRLHNARYEVELSQVLQIRLWYEFETKMELLLPRIAAEKELDTLTDAFQKLNKVLKSKSPPTNTVADEFEQNKLKVINALRRQTAKLLLILGQTRNFFREKKEGLIEEYKKLMQLFFKGKQEREILQSFVSGLWRANLKFPSADPAKAERLLWAAYAGRRRPAETQSLPALPTLPPLPMSPSRNRAFSEIVVSQQTPIDIADPQLTTTVMRPRRSI